MKFLESAWGNREVLCAVFHEIPTTPWHRNGGIYEYWRGNKVQTEKKEYNPGRIGGIAERYAPGRIQVGDGSVT